MAMFSGKTKNWSSKLETQPVFLKTANKIIQLETEYVLFVLASSNTMKGYVLFLKKGFWLATLFDLLTGGKS